MLKIDKEVGIILDILHFNKVNSIHEARAIFDLLGIKDVTKDWQSKQGTQVFELPFVDNAVNRILEDNIDDIQVIINGHRYNLT